MSHFLKTKTNVSAHDTMLFKNFKSMAVIVKKLNNKNSNFMSKNNLEKTVGFVYLLFTLSGN